MDLRKKPNGRWELRWREAGRKRGRTFDRKGGLYLNQVGLSGVSGRKQALSGVLR